MPEEEQNAFPLHECMNHAPLTDYKYGERLSSSARSTRWTLKR